MMLCSDSEIYRPERHSAAVARYDPQKDPRPGQEADVLQHRTDQATQW